MTAEHAAPGDHIFRCDVCGRLQEFRLIQAGRHADRLECTACRAQRLQVHDAAESDHGDLSRKA